MFSNNYFLQNTVDRGLILKHVLRAGIQRKQTDNFWFSSSHVFIVTIPAIYLCMNILVPATETSEDQSVTRPKVVLFPTPWLHKTRQTSPIFQTADIDSGILINHFSKPRSKPDVSTNPSSNNLSPRKLILSRPPPTH